MKISVFAYSRQGIRIAERLLPLTEEDKKQFFAPERIAGGHFSPIPMPSKKFYGEHFAEADALIFVGACGIAVRSIAPHIRSKQSDPAVLCIDERGQYVIPILSGHIGGANELAEKLASGLGAQAIITTATDINGKFSVDSWAIRNGFAIGDMAIAKEVSAAILEQDVALFSMLPVTGSLPGGLVLRDDGPIGIFIGWEKQDPFGKTLHLIPRNLHLGIGCRKGTAARVIKTAVDSVLEQHQIDPAAIKCTASIDLKANEPGLLEYCSSTGIPLFCYSAEELLSVPGNFTGSDFVKKITGVENVCERAAMMCADKLIIPKTVCEGVTIAVAAEMKEVCIE